MVPMPRLLIPIYTLALLASCPDVASSQDQVSGMHGETVPIFLRQYPEPAYRTLDDRAQTDIFSSFEGRPAANGNSKFRFRQALLFSGIAVSMLAYGYFALQFNNSRTDSEAARLAYDADVRENAQFYVDEGIPLDQIPSYRSWEESFTDAANARELITLAGLSAFLLATAAVLDAATAGKRRSSSPQARTVSPIMGVSPSTGDVILGARVGL